MDLSLKAFLIFRKSKLLGPDIQLRFLKRLARLLNNGYPLLEALKIVQWDNDLAPIARKITILLKNGYTVDQALSDLRFHPDITTYLYFVQANGDLESNIQKCTEIYEQRLNYLNKFKQTIRYPLILLSIFLILLIFLRQNVLPSFVDIFQMSDTSSATLNTSILIIESLNTFLLTIILFIFLCMIIWKIIHQKIPIHFKIKIYNLIPIYRQYKRLQTSFLFATHISTLIKTGMPIKEILKLLINQEKLPILSFYANEMEKELSKGVYVTSILTQLKFIDPLISTIFQKNADKDDLERDLTAYADYVTEELHRKMTKILAMLQPIFFTILASFIIFIYITLMWPMFQLIKTI